MGFFNILRKLFSSSARPYVRIGIGDANKQDVRQRWQGIQQNIALGKPSNFKVAILDADKLLDHVLKIYGYPGQTMGERMKSIPRSKYDRQFFDNMWQAHMLRNEMVHNSDYEVQSFEATQAIAKFEKTLRELDAF